MQDEGVDDTEPVGLSLQVWPDGDVGLDVHHDEMLAVLHRQEVEVGGDAGFSRRVDDNVEQRGGHQCFGRGDGDLAGLDGGVGLLGRRALGSAVLVAEGDDHRLAGGVRAASRDGADFDAPHQRPLRDEVGAHFA
jgi:hypothetical protein